mmetsp:Transcript_16043/g.34697  ORF Transcript_16043/g.34697 Transcript_16043/m.34697 type:complete len:288 (-) Transcript_16043:1592-2455(-)
MSMDAPLAHSGNSSRTSPDACFQAFSVENAETNEEYTTPSATIPSSCIRDRRSVARSVSPHRPQASMRHWYASGSARNPLSFIILSISNAITNSALEVSLASMIFNVDSLSLNRFRAGDFVVDAASPPPSLSARGRSFLVGVCGKSASMTISSTKLAISSASSCCFSFFLCPAYVEMMDLLSRISRESLSTAMRSFPTTAVNVMKKTVKDVTSDVAGFSTGPVCPVTAALLADDATFLAISDASSVLLVLLNLPTFSRCRSYSALTAEDMGRGVPNKFGSRSSGNVG